MADVDVVLVDFDSSLRNALIECTGAVSDEERVAVLDRAVAVLRKVALEFSQPGASRDGILAADPVVYYQAPRSHRP